MNNSFLYFLIGLFGFIFSFNHTCTAQSLTVEQLFSAARGAAFDDKDYAKAQSLSLQALRQSPDYHDIRIFSGRVYAWNKQPDSARIQFDYVLQRAPSNLEALHAYSNLEYWNENYEKALEMVSRALLVQPESEDLLLLKARILNGQRQFTEATRVVRTILSIDKTNAEARALASLINENVSANRVSLSYSFVDFDRQFNAQWHLSSFEYLRSTRLGSFAGRVNYANRFSRSGLQFEADAYPRLSKSMYAYLNIAASSEKGVFPEFKAGASVYTSLPASFEAEIGLRYLKFDRGNEIYTASLGKYVNSYWLNFRAYLSPEKSSWSQSYFLTSRYYYGGVDEYISLTLGTGISPDDTYRNILQGLSGYQLHTYSVGAHVRKSVKAVNVIVFNTSWSNQEFQQGQTGNQFEVGIGYQRRF